jgi:hypothetical protein
LGTSSGAREVRLVGSILSSGVGLELASLLAKWVGFSGSPGIFRNLVPANRGCFVFRGKQRPDQTEALPGLAGY